MEIEHDKGLLGHSDADVLVHAIMDAILGALALGDIGKHFPDTDPKYKGADSIKLLEFVNNLIESKGYKVNNIDSIIVAQAPKMAPHILKMRENVSKALCKHKGNNRRRTWFHGEQTRNIMPVNLFFN